VSQTSKRTVQAAPQSGLRSDRTNDLIVTSNRRVRFALRFVRRLREVYNRLPLAPYSYRFARGDVFGLGPSD
jgi:hypothetical protein